MGMNRLLVALVLCASAADAGTIWQQEPDSDWAVETDDPNAPRDPRPEGGFADPSERIFRGQLGRGLLDRLCRRAKLELHQDFDLADIGGVGGRLGRRLRQIDDRHEAIIDTVDVRFRVGHRFPYQVSERVNLNFHIGASAAVESTVIRSREGKLSCEELLQLADLRHVKTVFPFRASRIKDMAVGEVWKLPIRLSWGFAPSLGGGVGGLAVNITAGGRTKSGQAALTLYRMDAERLRMRFRLEDAVIYGHGGDVLGTVPAIAVGSLGANIIAEAVDSVIAKELAKFVQTQLGYFRSSSNGQSIIFEQILDPRDEEQMRALEKVIMGDLRDIISLLVRRRGLIPLDRPAYENAADLSRHYHSVLEGKDLSVLADTYSREAGGWTLRLPLLTRQGWHDSSASDKFERLGDRREEVRMYGAERERQRGYLYLPIVGAIVNDNNADSAQTLTPVVAGAAGPPAAVYIRQNAFERVGASSVREEAGRFSRLTALIGRESGSPTAVRTALPVDRFFPAGEARDQTRDGDPPQDNERSYEKGDMSLSVLVTPEGVTQAVSASNEAVVRAYANTLDETDRSVLRAVAASGFDPAEVRRQAQAAADAAGDTVSPRYYVELAERAALVVADMIRLREASDNDRRAALLARIIEGESESGLKYDEFMAVLVQLADPSQVRADFRINVRKGVKGLSNVNQRMRYNGGIDSEPLIARAARLRGPFAGPTDVTD